MASLSFGLDNIFYCICGTATSGIFLELMAAYVFSSTGFLILYIPLIPPPPPKAYTSFLFGCSGSLLAAFSFFSPSPIITSIKSFLLCTVTLTSPSLLFADCFFDAFTTAKLGLRVSESSCSSSYSSYSCIISSSSSSSGSSSMT